ncbi:RNA polymerase sigma factor SigI [Salimicrobium halophilum]|uniref:RNA polymerase sigma factor SigI n=1 Tax=Salimicrobium halophilum TaxID=86666 RepID=A0A1G8TK84_9BACI|nr:RNA polymerase sigma factor SigI [Salimicrobium halophilum]SDJ41853.1 RNA polymerase sigma factor [Salimicrobium halophilum]
MIRRLFKKEDTSLHNQVIAAQEGDEEARDDLISKYQPFIAKCASEVCKRYIDPNQDDEFSIGLIAFNDAIDSYAKDKGAAFLSFAKLIIKRRIIDFIRQQKSHVMFTSLDETQEDEEQMENSAEVRLSKEKFSEEIEAWYRREEIQEFQSHLQKFGLTFLDVTEASPKHADARESAIRVAYIVYEDKALRSKVLEKGRLPIKELDAKVDVSKKTLERNRKYIIALVLILSGDYVYLKDYLKGVKV